MLGLKTKKILALSLPIIGGMMSQNILTLIDTLMIGKLGVKALAAAGVGGFLFFVSFSAFTGLETSVQTMIARYKGASKPDMYAVPYYLGIIIVCLFSLLFVGVAFLYTHFFINFFSNDPDVVMTSVDYFRCRLIGLPFFTICLVARGFYNGISKPLRFLVVIVVIHSLNIFLNYGLIYGNLGFPSLGISGAGIASSVAIFVGALVYVVDCRRYVSFRLVLKKPYQVLIENVQWLIKLGIPSAIQQFLFALGVAMFFWILSCLGTTALAIGNVLVNIILVGILPGVGMGIATTSLVSESLGKKKFQEAFWWPFHVTKIAIIILGPLFCFALLCPRMIISPFIEDVAIVELAVIPLRLDTIGVFIEIATLIFLHALLGAGKNTYVMCVSFISQWLIYLPLAYLIGITLEVGMNGVWGMWIVFQLIQVSCFAGNWYRLRVKQLKTV